MQFSWNFAHVLWNWVFSHPLITPKLWFPSKTDVWPRTVDLQFYETIFVFGFIPTNQLGETRRQPKNAASRTLFFLSGRWKRKGTNWYVWRLNFLAPAFLTTNEHKIKVWNAPELSGWSSFRVWTLWVFFGYATLVNTLKRYQTGPNILFHEMTPLVLDKIGKGLGFDSFVKFEG